MVEEWSLDAHHHVDSTEDHGKEEENGKKTNESSWAENLLDVHVVEWEVAVRRNDWISFHSSGLSLVSWGSECTKDEAHKSDGVCSGFHYCLTKE